MSFMTDVDIYRKMVSDEILRKPCTIDQNSADFMVLTKYEDTEETLVVGEEIVVHEDVDMKHQISEVICEPKEQISEYVEGSINTIPAEYTTDSISLSIENIAKQKWIKHNTQKQGSLLLGMEDNISEISNKVTNGDQDGDEETIATFVTAAGQQLALYAVEDSDEIFAVALYDESGEPPTNFQFLMKADVERLIGEGAVRTVKKPTQIKKQLLTAQPPIFFPKSEPTSNIEMHNEDKTIIHENERLQEKESILEENSNLIADSDLNLNMKQVPNIIYTTRPKQSDVTYLMMDNSSINMDTSEEYEEDESDGEIIEQSTVQYILFENDQSDSELTFDEIHETLQNLKSANTKISGKDVNKKTIKSSNDYEAVKETEYELSRHKNPSLSKHISNTLTERKLNLVNGQPKLLETLTDSTVDVVSNSTNLDISNSSIECTSPETSRMNCKAKRSRKQQLISVNREDSEIIIQPASLLNEEDNYVRKKGKRKRKVVTHSGYRQRNNESRMKKIKCKEVEIIEIDVDEEESALQSKRDVVEITIDDSKDKYSSDKENEIIMVGDSDDELQQSNSKVILLQCQHCSRNFRQQRALETHLRVCSESPSNAIRFNKQKLRANRTCEIGYTKQYTCKICQQTFDVVVALARHVRSEHSQRKKRQLSKLLEKPSSIEIQEKEKYIESKKQLTMIKKIKRKKNQRPNCTWEVKKLSCSDCGRWFPSVALLRSHYLQHGTKKSDQQIRKCQICKKLIRSRLLFVQHLEKHRTLLKNIKANIQKKLYTTRSVTGKITALRKRGRPRKL